jgi:hypothetical protein
MPTKYVANTAVRTTVVYPELAKSNIAHANTSLRLTPGSNAELFIEACRFIKIKKPLILLSEADLKAYVEIAY